MSEEKDKTGYIVAIIAGIVLLAALYVMGAFAGSGHAEGIRGTLSADWHHAKCLVKFCDEDGRCPVWSSKYSKCYMLDEKEGEDLKEFEGSKAKKGMFELYMLEVKGRKI